VKVAGRDLSFAAFRAFAAKAGFVRVAEVGANCSERQL